MRWQEGYNLASEVSAMATATVQAQVDAEVVSQATAVLNKQGMDVSEAVGLLLARVARNGALMLEPGENAAYDSWVCAKVQEALNDPRPPISNEEAKRRWSIRREQLLAKAEAIENARRVA